MAHGKLQVCGSSMWLKRKFGVGYNLSVDTLHASKVLSKVQSYIPDVVCNETTSEGLSCSLKLSHQSKFPDMLDAIDAMAEVQHYGMEMPTLEEVFIRLAVAGDQVDGGAKRRRTNSSITSYNSGQLDEIKVDNEEKSGERHRLPAPGPMHPTWSGQTKTMLGKRFLIGKRNPYVMFQQICVPVLFMLPVFLVKYFLSQNSMITNAPSIAINAKIQLYDNNQQIADDFPFWLYGSSEKNATGTDVMRQLPIPGRSNTEKQPFAKVVEENEAMSPYTFNNMMLDKGNCFGGIQTTTTTDKTTDNTYVTANVTFNSTFTSSPAILIAWIDTAAYRLTTENPTAIPFAPTLVPFKNPYQPNDIDYTSVALGMVLGTMIALGFAVIPAIAVTAIVEERETSVLHQQLLSGANVAGYWLSNFLYDLIIFVPVLFATVSVILVLGLPGLSNDYLFVVILMIILFAVQALPLAYIISHLFSSSVTAMNMTRAFFSLSGSLLTISFSIIVSNLQGQQTLIYMIQVLFGAVPNAGLAQGLQKLTLMGAICEMEKKAPGGGGTCTHNNPWDFSDGVGLYILSFFGYSILYGCIVVYIEKKRLQPPKYTVNNCAMDNNEDIDVANERQTAAVAEHPVVHVNRLRKVYKARGLTPETVAVHDLSLAIERGICFGLLGPNGAGKTTAMSMLTGTAWATQGTASIASHDIHDDIHSIHKKIGFCPQFHGLFPAMTVDEHLIYYGELKGMSMPAIQAFIRVLTNSLDMEEHRNKLSKHLSGGNKRKLSLALSMMGAPDVMILDEPSAGIDPNARQNMVNIIKGERANRCIILTTHLVRQWVEFTFVLFFFFLRVL